MTANRRIKHEKNNYALYTFQGSSGKWRNCKAAGGGVGEDPRQHC